MPPLPLTNFDIQSYYQILSINKEMKKIYDIICSKYRE